MVAGSELALFVKRLFLKSRTADCLKYSADDYSTTKNQLLLRTDNNQLILTPL